MADETEEPGRPASRLSVAVRNAVAGWRLLEPGDHVLVGVSGGPDSVALLHALVLVRSEHRLRLTVCHVHHGLRPEADRDAAFVETLAARFGCPARVVRVSVPRGGGVSPEEAARGVRHAALARVARETGAHRIALGHTADDQVETVFMRVLEGAGPRGLAGIPVRRGRVVRPLLEIDRAGVLAHLELHGLEALEDATNRDTKFFRNRVRHEILPLLAAQAGRHVPAALRRVARASREAVEALDSLVQPRLLGQLTPTPVGWRLALGAVVGLPVGAQKAALRMALLEVAADRIGSGLRAAPIAALTALLDAPAGARVRLPRGVAVERGRDALWILRPAADLEPAALPVPGQAGLGGPMDVAAEVVPRGPDRLDASANEVWFDATALGVEPPAGGPPGESLVVRPRRLAERIVPFGATEPVRLTKLLAGAGVPRHARGRWPVVALGSEVLWLVGVRRGAAAPLTGATRRVLRLRAAPARPPGLPPGDAV
jgi:tRNA(Ile)-lysidine synthase